MTLFLTSSPSGCPFEPSPCPALDRKNGLITRLRAAWPEEPPEGLYLAADPEAHGANDEACRFFCRLPGRRRPAAGRPDPLRQP